MTRRTLTAAGLTALAVALWPAGPAPDGRAAAQAARQDALVLVMGQDTFGIENLTRTATSLEGELTGRAFGRMAYRLDLGPGGSARELTLRAWMPGRTDEAAPVQQVRVTLDDDSATVEVTGAAGSRTDRLATRPGAVPYLNPSFGMLEAVLARARAEGGSSVVVPLFLVQGGQTVDATVTWAGADSATIALGGTTIHAVLDPDGSVRRAAVPAQRLTVTRVDGVHLPPAGLEPPDYSAPPGAPYAAEPVRVATPAGHVLAGTLTRPATGARVPAVVLITGSGAQDRDQALPVLRGYRPFREIADTLSRRGIAVLRLDDRGFGESTGDFAAATSADLADDIRAALAWLRTRDDVDPARLGLIGHSEGGLIAPMIAATDTALAGIVLIAGPSRTGREVIEYQQRYAIDQAGGIAEAVRDSVYRAASAQLDELAERSPWIRFFLDHDPLESARQVRRTPVLVLHGATDRQVTADQADELAAAFREAGNPDVALRVLPDVNHLLIRDPDGNPAGYVALTERRVAPEVLAELVDWLVARLR
jgi:uncharacterized protein